MRGITGIGAAWETKLRDGKMFQRFCCDRCGTRFHFTDGPRVTRFPRCPLCGDMGAHPDAA
jgi:hypothetical protein